MHTTKYYISAQQQQQQHASLTLSSSTSSCTTESRRSVFTFISLGSESQHGKCDMRGVGKGNNSFHAHLIHEPWPLAQVYT
jgi:hypothetical protein